MTSPNPKSHFHARLVSLHSKPNPLIPQVEEQELRSHHTFIFIDTQNALVQEGRDEVLERSLSLPDLCSAVKEVIAQMKENMQELQSTLRRRRGDDPALRNRIEAYLTSRKKAKKTIQTCLKNLKMKSNFSSADQCGMTTVSMLREAEEVAFGSIESLLTLVHGKSRSCSFFGKLMHSKRVAADERAFNSELEEVDSVVHTLLSHKNGKPIQMEYLQKILGENESSIEALEIEVKHLTKRLIKTRVSLLNILNH